MLRSFLIPTVVLAGAIVLLLSGFEKAQDLASIEAILKSHAFLTDPDLIPWASRVVPACEIIGAALALLWLLRKRPRPALLLLTLVAASLAFYALALVVDPPPAPTKCGCGAFRGAGAADWTFISTINFLAAAALSLLRAFAK